MIRKPRLYRVYSHIMDTYICKISKERHNDYVDWWRPLKGRLKNDVLFRLVSIKRNGEQNYEYRFKQY